MHTKLAATVFPAHGPEVDHCRFPSLDEEADLGEVPSAKAKTHWTRLIEAVPAETHQRRFIVRDECPGLALAFEQHLDRYQGADATLNGAPQKAEVRQIDEFGREVVRIAHRNQVDGNGTFGIRPGKQTTGKLP
jgi:hypothetical protein